MRTENNFFAYVMASTATSLVAYLLSCVCFLMSQRQLFQLDAALRGMAKLAANVFLCVSVLGLIALVAMCVWHHTQEKRRRTWLSAQAQRERVREAVYAGRYEAAGREYEQAQVEAPCAFCGAPWQPIWACCQDGREEAAYCETKHGADDRIARTRQELLCHPSIGRRAKVASQQERISQLVSDIEELEDSLHRNAGRVTMSDAEEAHQHEVLADMKRHLGELVDRAAL